MPVIKREKKSTIPSSVSPMLCTLVKEPMDDPDFIYEIKWDGYRIIAYVNAKRVRMDSRSGLDYTAKYPVIAKALRDLKHNMVIDGEVVVFNAEGNPDFDALQLYNGHESPIHYCVFDLIWLDGKDCRKLPLTERKKLLKSIVKDNPVIRFSESFDDGRELYRIIQDKNLEGIVAKKKNSFYLEGVRGNDWLKIPTRKRQEFVIGGWAESERARSFRSLLFGAYKNGKLEWIGRSGGGFKEKEMPAILAKLEKLEINKSPFENKVLDTKGAKMHWVKPKLVANFEFATWTKTGRIRKPATFLGFRKDKNAKDVVREIPAAVLPQTQGKKIKQARKPSTAADSNWRVLEKIKVKERAEFEVDNCNIELTDVDRNIWKNISKAALIDYYHSMSRYILLHLKSRPLSLHIKPVSAQAPGFYIKDMEGREPSCATIFTDKRRHKAAGKRDVIDYLVCNNEATLIYLVNLGCIDINPWMSRTDNPGQPDFINIDLDPSDDNFEKVIDAALAAKQVLDQLKLKAFVKTSGKTGMHIYIPVRGVDYKYGRKVAETLGTMIQQLVPDISTTSVSIQSRGDKLFIDPSQNDYADTLASVYSVRPYHLPTVSTPLEWKEIKKSLDPSVFTMKKLIERTAKKGDLFAGVLSEKTGLENAKKIRF